jgi:hypothetical protein
MWPVVAEVQDALVYPDGVIEAPIAIAGPVAAEPVPAACRKKAKDVSDVVQDTMHGPHCMRVERREEKGTDLARERQRRDEGLGQSRASSDTYCVSFDT